MEKIHGTSAHVHWNELGCPDKLSFFSGGEKQERFELLFNRVELSRIFTEEVGAETVTVYGEAYGGKQQGMSQTYGKELKFVVFDVKIGDCWLAVPKAEDVCIKLGLEFVAYSKVSTDIEALDAERDLFSTQAQRNGVEGEHIREGVVLRPLIEVIKNNGARIITKHKREEFRERKSIPNIDPAMREKVEKAEAIAEEWCTPMRLVHVLDKFPDAGMEQTGNIIKAMVEDVLREGDEEIVDSKPARKAIGQRTVVLFKKHLQDKLRGENQ